MEHGAAKCDAASAGGNGVDLRVSHDKASRVITGFDSFDLHVSCHCGQAFRWRRSGQDGEIEEGVVKGKLLRLEQRGGELVVHPPVDDDTVQTVVEYFRLGTAHAALEAELAQSDEIMRVAVALSRGLRLVAQDPWECLVSYIISVRNAIPQISRVVENIATTWGRRLEDGAGARYSFPEPHELAAASEGEIAACKAGFRSRSICEAASRVASGELNLEHIAALDYTEAKRELLRFRGVGQKVADCVLLLSMDKFEAFPVDVWIERAVRHLYFGGQDVSHDEIRQWASRKFGSMAGLAQEYLFAYARTSIPDRLKKQTGKMLA